MRVKLLDGVVFDLDLEVTDQTMVDELKRLIAEHSDGAPIERQRVIFRGKVLKEGHTLREYGVSSDSTVHLVARPEAATNPPQTEPIPVSEPIAPAALGAGGVFMSTVNIGDGESLPDFNDIVNRMLTSIPGVAAASTMASTTTTAPPQMIATSVDSIRQQLNHAARVLSATEAVVDLTLSNDVPSVAQTTAQLRELCSTLSVLLNQIQAVLQRPSLATDAEARAHTERICGQLAQALVMLGPAVQQLGGILAQTRLGSAPGQEQIQLPSAGVTVAIHVPDQEPGTALSEPSAPQPPLAYGQADISQTFALNGPIAVRARRTVQRSAARERSASGNRSAAMAARANANGAGPNNTRPDISSVLNSVASMLGGTVRPPAHTGPARSGSPRQRNPAQPSAPQSSRSVPPAAERAHSQQSSSANGSQRQPAFPADIFQMLAPVVSSMLGSGGTGSVGDLASFMPTGDASDSEPNRFDMLLSIVMSRLQLPDLMAIFGGDWSCVEPLRGEIRSSIIENFMHGNDTPDSRRQVVDEITDILVSHINNDDIINPVRANLRPGVNISTDSREILHSHVQRCISFILGDEVPFAPELKRLLTIAIGHWIDSACSWFTDGSVSVELMMKRLVQSRVETLGPEFAMLGSFSSGILTTMMMQCRSQYLQAANSNASSSGNEQWMLELPPAIALEWRRIIVADMTRQSDSQPQPPLSNSYAYRSGNI